VGARQPQSAVVSLSRAPASASLGGHRGLGYLLQFAQSTYNAALTMGLIFLIMGFVLVLFFCAEVVERWLLRWRYRGTDRG